MSLILKHLFATIDYVTSHEADLNVPIAAFGTDSRTIERGMLFFALKGERVDGHQFLGDVAKKGACAAVVSKTYRGETFGLPCLYVEDVLGTLQKLAQEVMKQRKSRVIGVTGSVGKTTTKEFIATLLEGSFSVEKNKGNSNSQVGLPLTILNSEEKEILILEMGMTLPGHISKLVSIAPPDISVITKIGHAHIGFFSDGLEGIARAKMEILSHPKTRCALLPIEVCHFNLKTAVGLRKEMQDFELESLPRGDDHSQKGKAPPLGRDSNSKGCVYLPDPTAVFRFKSMESRSNCSLRFFGSTPLCDYVLENKSSEITILERGERSPSFLSPFRATHFLENMLIAIAVCRELGVSWEMIQQRVGKLQHFQRRFECKEKDGVYFVDDSYNASPESMKAALHNLPKAPSGNKRIAVFGEMVELGVFSLGAHRSVAEAALDQIDHLLCFGKGCLPMVEIFSREGRPVEYFEDFLSLKKRLKEIATTGDVVLLKGSNSKGLWRLLED